MKKLEERQKEKAEIEKEQENEEVEQMKTFNNKKMAKEQIEKSSQRLYDDAKRLKMKLESKRKERMVEDDNFAFEEMLRNTNREKDKKEKEAEERDMSASKFKKKKKSQKYTFYVIYH